MLLLLLTVMAGSCGMAQTRIVENGNPVAVIVTADEPFQVAEYAAAELAAHVAKATGAKLPVVTESVTPPDAVSRVFIGMTQAAAEHGIDAAALAPEEFVIRTVGADLYIVGDEDNANPLSESNSRCGTLFGVYEFIERWLRVRWLWPGELGTYIPRTDTVVVPPTDERIVPRLDFRAIVWNRVQRVAVERSRELENYEKRLGFSWDVLLNYGQDLQIYLRRHRMGGLDRKPSTGHIFSGWWDKYGEEHPEWFMMQEDGSRGPAEGWSTWNVPMCVSNPELHRFIIDQWDGESTIRLGEVDRLDACHCPRCKSWDGPQPDALPEFLQSPNSSLKGFYWPMCTSDRYARFWLTIQQMAAERNPNALVTTYIYYNYFPAPVTDIKLNRNIYGEFVPWGNPEHSDFFPMSEDAFAWLKDQWTGWQRTGMRMGYRPNYMHDGYVMPHVDVQQACEFFKFAVDHGMEGCHYDSLTGQWATQGPKLYVHIRLFAKPELSVEHVLEEYYSAYGPAARAVREYFKYWERYCIDNAQLINTLYHDVGHRWWRFHVKAHQAFPLESFVPAEALLEQALHAAQADPDPRYAQRVDFLQKGLEHAKLSAELAACFNGRYTIPPDSEDFARAVAALNRLVKFRRAHEGLYFSDLLEGASWREEGLWNLNPLFERLHVQGEDVQTTVPTNFD